MSLNNLLALSTSLPLHVILNALVPRDVMPLQLANVLCALRPISQFIFLKVGLFTLTGVCIDRYEIFTMMSEPKILTKQRAGKLVVASWLIAATSSLLAGYGYIQNALQDEVYCEMSPPDFVKGLESKQKGVSNIWVITDVSVWITACNIIDVYTLWAVGKVLVKHIAAVRSTLGAQETLQEIKVVKLAVYVWVAYAIIWMPYGVARGLFFSQKEPKTTVKCLYIITQTVAYAIFAVIPFVYIDTNRQMFKDIIQRVRQATRATFSRNRRLVVTFSKDTVDIELTLNTAETNVSSQM